MSSDTINIENDNLAEEAPPPVESSLFGLIPGLLIFVLFYLFLLRPQEKKRKAHAEFVAGVKRGDEVLVTNSFYGIVNRINDSDHTVMLQISPNNEIKIAKSAITDIINGKKPAEKLEKKDHSKKK
jgi:preprotein translocase subunit YajC